MMKLAHVAALGIVAIALTVGAGQSSGADLLAEPIPECPDSLYLEYYKNGNRSRYEKCYSARRDLMTRLADAERRERKGRYLPRLVEVIDAICAMKSWSLPAHDYGHGCLDGRFMVVELVSSGIARSLTSLAVDPQVALPAATVAKIRAEVDRRILAPYLAHVRGKLKVGNWWWCNGKNNWNAVCHANIVRTALDFYPFGNPHRAEIVRSAVGKMPVFLSGFTDDGYCSEGAGYWNYGFGHFMELAFALRDAPEKIDLLASAKAKTVARYGFTYWMSPKTSPCFADGSGVPGDWLLKRCASVWPDLQHLPLAVRDTFDIAQVYLLRPGGGRSGLSVGFKGGHNAEFHNHNDLGSYDIALGDVIVSGDPGGECYTRRTFSSHRYDSKVLNSYAHPVPRVAGRLQGTGRAFAAKEMRRSFTSARDTVTLDLTAGYACPALKSLTRTFTYERATRRLRVTDSVTFLKPSDFDDPVVTLGVFKDVRKDGFAIVRDGARLEVDVRVRGARASWDEEVVENPERLSPHLRTLRLKGVRHATVEFIFRP